MAINIIPEAREVVRIKVVGIGGAGINVVNHLIQENLSDAHYVAIDTNADCVNYSLADIKLQLGEKSTGGLGTGAKPELGRTIAEESRKKIQEAVGNCDMVFISAGMGGGTGSGTAPVVAEITKSLGILTVAIVTKPFAFEGRGRMTVAEDAIQYLEANADAILVIPNDNLKYASESKITFRNAFQIADNVLHRTVEGSIEVIQKPAYINSDFADICSILRNTGRMHIGMSQASSTDRIDQIIHEIVSSRLLETSLNGAKGVLLCVTASPDVEFDEIERISSAVQQSVDTDANIIFGLDFQEDAGDSIKAMVIASAIGGIENTTKHHQ